MLAVRALLSFAVLTLVGLFGCGRNDTQIQVTYEAPRGSPPIEHLRVYVGASKSSWPVLQPQQAVAVSLSPSGELPDPSMTFELGGRKHDWRGPSLRNGAAYRFDVRILHTGAVTERHCILPCDLK